MGGVSSLFLPSSIGIFKPHNSIMNQQHERGLNVKRIQDYPQVAGAIGAARESLGLEANRRIDHWACMDLARKSAYIKRTGIDICKFAKWSELSGGEKAAIEKEVLRVLKLVKADAEAMGVA
ncbi:MAG: hypothetical protein KZQ79_00605 [Candidatus Thiodiazotropha sp. (ex Lucinoma borealis)]|nr:hypothetical protein [Candidatus Thiodiazotropha sp. (ex Lucinoma borealis)]